MFDNFAVHRASNLVQSVNGAGKYDLKETIPDHSLLTWDILFDSVSDDFYTCNDNKRQLPTIKTKFDLQNIPVDFMLSQETIRALESTILKLETSHQTQCDIDFMYEEFVNMLSKMK